MGARICFGLFNALLAMLHFPLCILSLYLCSFSFQIYSPLSPTLQLDENALLGQLREHERALIFGSRSAEEGKCWPAGHWLVKILNSEP